MHIRNFCIIAHIDHGKSTLADRLLEMTNTVSKREMRNQILDQMDLERERGITIKLQPVRMDYQLDDVPYVLNLIDTPGHVDFGYEVSRSLAAVEGAILLVDATQGIQAQTLANLYLALEQNITIIPVINKIDLPSARIEEVRQEIVHLIGCDGNEICAVSGKTGEGVDELLRILIKRIPAPSLNKSNGSRALIFDSIYDEFRGVIAYVRIFDGDFKKSDYIFFKASKSEGQILETGFFRPRYMPSERLEAGEIGYIITGLKEVTECRVGDTIVIRSQKNVDALEGYKEVKPMVFAGIFCKDGDAFKRLRDAIEKLKLNDAALTYEGEHSPALGFGFRCGFLGMLHLDVVQERLKREYGLELIVTVPSVAYYSYYHGGIVKLIKSPSELEDEGVLEKVEEPWMTVDIIAPESSIGAIMTLVTERRGIYRNTEYLSGDDARSTFRRVILRFELPLSAILVDFYDALKSVSSGYASLNYEFFGYREADVMRLDIFVAHQKVDALTTIVYRDAAYYVGRKIVSSLKELLSRQQFEIKIQATIGAKVIASERIAPFRKDVTAKLYGGDVTRKQKLLEKQKKGKKRMQITGVVDIPTEAYLSVLKR